MSAIWATQWQADIARTKRASEGLVRQVFCQLLYSLSFYLLLPTQVLMLIDNNATELFFDKGTYYSL